MPAGMERGNCHQEYRLKAGHTAKNTAMSSEVHMLQLALSKLGRLIEQPSPTQRQTVQTPKAGELLAQQAAQQPALNDQAAILH